MQTDIETSQLINQLQDLSQKHANNTNEPLAAHWLTPLVTQIAIKLDQLEEDVDEILDTAEIEPPMSEELLENIQDFLFEVGFETYRPDAQGQLPPFVMKSRALWMQWRSEEEEVGVEEFATSFLADPESARYFVESPEASEAAPTKEVDAKVTVETQPVVTQPVVTQPVVTQPVVTQPVVTQPVVTQPVVTQPVVTQPVVTQPVVTQPVVTQPVVTQPVVTQPVVTTPPKEDEDPKEK